jgi:hypothetical protein
VQACTQQYWEYAISATDACTEQYFDNAPTIPHVLQQILDQKLHEAVYVWYAAADEDWFRN